MKKIQVQQYDFNQFLEVDKKPSFDEFGFFNALTTPAVTGIMEYLTLEGKVIRQLVPEETLRDTKAMKSLEDKPVTFEHPKVNLTSKDASKHSKGHVKQGVYFEGSSLYAPITINDKDTIEQIMTGKAFEVSPGYICELEEAEQGATWNGQPYDYIQRNRRYNHLAIVKIARGGRKTKVHLDGKEEKCATIGYSSVVNNDSEDTMTKILVSLNDAQVELEGSTATQVQRFADDMKQKVSNLDKENKDVKKEYEDMCKEYDEKSKALDSLKGKSDAMTKELEDMKKKMSDMKDKNNFDSAQLDVMVEERQEVLKVAGKVIENFDSAGKDNLTVIREVLNNKYNADGKEEACFTKKSDDYCKGAFALLKDSIADEKLQTQADAIARATSKSPKAESSADVRRKFMEENQGK